MKNEKIFEDDNIIIYHDLKGYDFEYHIENKKDEQLVYYLNGIDMYLTFRPYDFLNFLGGETDNDIIRCFKEGDAELYNFSNDIYNFYKELEEKESKKEKIDLKYVKWRLYWLEDVAKKIFE